MTLQRLHLRRRFQITLLAMCVIALMGAGDQTDRFNKLGHGMMCTCGCGQVLLECNHVGCQVSDKMRDELIAGLSRGDNDDLILQGFVQNYGPTVIAAPVASGFNYIAWIVPFAALAAGIAFVVIVVRSWRGKPEPALADGIVVPPSGELSEWQRRVRRETES